VLDFIAEGLESLPSRPSLAVASPSAMTSPREVMSAAPKAATGRVANVRRQGLSPYGLSAALADRPTNAAGKAATKSPGRRGQSRQAWTESSPRAVMFTVGGDF
jgi:hypothetical protein